MWICLNSSVYSTKKNCYKYALSRFDTNLKRDPKGDTETAGQFKGFYWWNNSELGGDLSPGRSESRGGMCTVRTMSVGEVTRKQELLGARGKTQHLNNSHYSRERPRFMTTVADETIWRRQQRRSRFLYQIGWGDWLWVHEPGHQVNCTEPTTNQNTNKTEGRGQTTWKNTRSTAIGL